MNLTVIRTKDWVSIVDPVLGIGSAGKDYVEAFTAFGRSMHSHELTLKQSIVKREPSRIGSVSELMSDIEPKSKPDTGFPCGTEGMISLEVNVTRSILKEKGWIEVSHCMFTKTFEDNDGSKYTYKLPLIDAYVRELMEDHK